MQDARRNQYSRKSLPVRVFTCRHSMLLLYFGAAFFATANIFALADDWGYDGVKAPLPVEKPYIEEQSAANLTKSYVKPSKSLPASAKTSQKSAAAAVAPNKSSAKQAGTGKTTSLGNKAAVPPSVVPDLPSVSRPAADSVDAFIDKDQQAARCWVQLFQACAKQKMDYTQQKQMEAYMLGKGRAGAKQADELRSIMKFWPKLMTDLRDKPEMEMHYADLFKALLRLHERTGTEKTHVEASPFSSDADLISELLGLQRLAVPGDPPFTEDAVNAYADMAVFIYEQQHAGRTIDANDNRTLFAKVVVEKFNRAPTTADQQAMASFDLAWAKFKIIWFSSDEKTQKLLLEKLVRAGANSTLTVAKDPLMDAVLSNWPWKTTP